MTMIFFSITFQPGERQFRDELYVKHSGAIKLNREHDATWNAAAAKPLSGSSMVALLPKAAKVSPVNSWPYARLALAVMVVVR